MQLTNKVRKQILEGFIDIFPRIANKAYQKRVWIKGEGPECDDFDETVNQFVDIGEPLIEDLKKDYKKFNISKNQYQILIQFYKEFEAFANDHYHPLEFIDSPEWERIMNMAKDVLEAFDRKQER